MEHDYSYSRCFAVTEDFLTGEHIFLRCNGLDTLASIKLNGVLIGKADNMHRTWLFDVKPFLKAGERNINVTLSLTPGTSAIKSTNGNRQEEGVYYSLNGQKLRVTDGSSEMKANSLSKGIYVKNGKKVVIR